MSRSIGRRQVTPSVLPSSLAQTFEHMGMILRPVPRHAPADKHVESSWCDGNGLCQCFLRLLDATALAEGRGEPAILVRVIRVSASAALSRLNRRVIFAGQVIANRDDERTPSACPTCLLEIAAHVLKRQHRDRRLVGQGQRTGGIGGRNRGEERMPLPSTKIFWWG